MKIIEKIFLKNNNEIKTELLCYKIKNDDT